MDKIKALLEKAGVKPELSEQICGAFENYRTTLREQLEVDYQSKVEEAKRVCVEEVTAHKRELARRLQIFLETKSNAIDTALLKQSALRDTEATSRLRQIVQLVEGIEPNGAPNGQSQAVVEKLKRKLAAVNEEKDRAVEVANRQTALANKVLSRNRELETEVTRYKADNATTAPLHENRQPANQGRRVQRLDGARSRQSRPASTRATLVESQDRRPAQTRQQPNTTGTKPGFDVDNIAANMDEIL